MTRFKNYLRDWTVNMSKQPVKQPEMIPMPGPSDEKGEGYVPPPPNPQEDLQFVAALAANTQSQVGQISENIIEGSESLQPSKFDAHAMVKQHMNSSGAPALQPVQQQAQQLMQQQQQLPQIPLTPAPAPAPALAPAPQALIPASYDDGQMLRRLLAIEDKLDNLERMGDKILRSLLKKNTKQVTIRFDDSKDTKQK